MKHVTVDWFVFGEALSQADSGFNTLGYSRGLDGLTVGELEQRANVGEWVNTVASPRLRYAFDLLPDGRVAFAIRPPGRKVHCHAYVMGPDDFVRIPDPFRLFASDTIASSSESSMSLGEWRSLSRFVTRHSAPLPQLTLRFQDGASQPTLAEVRTRLVSEFGEDEVRDVLGILLDLLLAPEEQVVVPETADGFSDEFVRLAWLVLPRVDRARTSFSTHVVPATSRAYRLSCVPRKYLSDLRPPVSVLGAQKIPRAAAAKLALWVASGSPMHAAMIDYWDQEGLSWLEKPTLIDGFGAFETWLAGTAPGSALELAQVLSATVRADGRLMRTAGEQLPHRLRDWLDARRLDDIASFDTLVSWMAQLHRDTCQDLVTTLVAPLQPSRKREVVCAAFRIRPSEASQLHALLVPLAADEIGALFQNPDTRHSVIAGLRELAAFVPHAMQIASAAVEFSDFPTFQLAIARMMPDATAYHHLLEQVLQAKAGREFIDVILTSFSAQYPAAAAETVEAKLSSRQIALAAVEGDFGVFVSLSAVRRLLAHPQWEPPDQAARKRMHLALGRCLRTQETADEVATMLCELRNAGWHHEFRGEFAAQFPDLLLRFPDLAHTLAGIDLGIAGVLFKAAIPQVKGFDELAQARATQFVARELAESRPGPLEEVLRREPAAERFALLFHLRARRAIPVHKAHAWDEMLLKLSLEDSLMPTHIRDLPFGVMDDVAPALSQSLARELLRRRDWQAMIDELLNTWSIEAALMVCERISSVQIGRKVRAKWAGLIADKAGDPRRPFENTVLRNAARRIRGEMHG